MSCVGASPSPMGRGSWSRCISAWARSWPTSSTTRTGAVASYLAVLEQESRSPEALEALERIYFRAEQWEDLYQIYEKMLDIAPGDEALSDCYARMARITSDVLGQRERAVELWRRVLDLRGADPGALSALADLHEQAEEWRELTEVLDSQIRATEDPEARIPAYKRLGHVWGEKLGRERNALECWKKVIEINPGDVEALQAIAANYRSAAAWEELSDTLRRLIAVGSETFPAATLQGLLRGTRRIGGQHPHAHRCGHRGVAPCLADRCG